MPDSMTLCRRTLLKALGANAAATLLLGGRPGFTAANPASIPDTKSTLQLTKSLSQQIADFIVRSRFQDLPTEVIQKAKEQIVYHFGLAFSGWSTREATVMREVVRKVGSSPKGATVIADKMRLDPSEAAFANCVLMRATWRDDVVWPAGIHAGLMTLPTALALGEVGHVSGKDLLLSVVLGYEVLGKLGRAAESWAAPLPRRPTMIFGAYGPVTVGCRLLKLEHPFVANALGYAANLGMGVPEGGQMDHFYGLLSRNATFAVQLAASGGIPYSDATIEGPTGLYQSFFGEIPAVVPKLIASLGSPWEILGAAQKRYPGTSQNTVATELLLRMITEEKLTAERVTQLKVFVSFAEESPERKKELTFRGPFKNWMDAYSSLPYAYAIALADGKVDPARFRDGVLNDAKIAEIMGKISMTFEPGHGDGRYCRIEVQTIDDRKLTRDSEHSPISEKFTFSFPQSDWSGWLHEDGSKKLSAHQLERLEQHIVHLEALDDVSKMMSTVRSE